MIAGIQIEGSSSQGGGAANQWVLPHRCPLNIVKKLTIFEVSSTVPCGVQAEWLNTEKMALLEALSKLKWGLEELPS